MVSYEETRTQSIVNGRIARRHCLKDYIYIYIYMYMHIYFCCSDNCCTLTNGTNSQINVLKLAHKYGYAVQTIG